MKISAISSKVLAGSIAALMVGGIFATQAGAAPKPKVKPVCNLLTDAEGDAKFLVLPSDPNLDIISGDIATSDKSLTAVLRLKSFSASDAQSTLGRNYYILFNVPGQANPVYLSAEAGTTSVATGFAYSFGTLVGGAVGTYTAAKDTTAIVGAIDPAAGTITMTVPLAALAQVATVKKGVKISGLHAESTQAFVVLVSTVDSADGGKSYVAGTPSCVKVA